MALGEKSFFWDKPAGALAPEELQYYEYAAQDLASVYETMYTTGIAPTMAVTDGNDNPENYIGSSLACNPGDGLNVVFSPGAAMIKGRFYIATLPITMPVSAGVTTDFFVRLDLKSNKPTITLQAKQRGSGASIEQNLTHEALIYDIAVATLTIPQGAVSIDISMITDQRLNNTPHPTDSKPISGLMRSIPFVETQGIYEQWKILKKQIESIISDALSQILPDMSVTTPKFAPDAKSPFAGTADISKVADKAKNGVHNLGYAKVGTVHKLTGLSGKTGVLACVFTASESFFKGDTIMIDGVSYEILLSDGNPAPDKLFVSGATVPVIIDTGTKKVNFKAAGLAFDPAHLQSTSMAKMNPFFNITQYSKPKNGEILTTSSDNNFRKLNINTGKSEIIFSNSDIYHAIGFSLDRNYVFTYDYSNGIIKKYSSSGSLISSKKIFNSTSGFYARIGRNGIFAMTKRDGSKNTLDYCLLDENLNYKWEKRNIPTNSEQDIASTLGDMADEYICAISGAQIASYTYKNTVHRISLINGEMKDIQLNENFASSSFSKVVCYDNSVYMTGALTDRAQTDLAVFNDLGTLIAKKNIPGSMERIGTVIPYKGKPIYAFRVQNPDSSSENTTLLNSVDKSGKFWDTPLALPSPPFSRPINLNLNSVGNLIYNFSAEFWEIISFRYFDDWDKLFN